MSLLRPVAAEVDVWWQGGGGRAGRQAGRQAQRAPLRVVTQLVHTCSWCTHAARCDAAALVCILMQSYSTLPQSLHHDLTKPLTRPPAAAQVQPRQRRHPAGGPALPPPRGEPALVP